MPSRARARRTTVLVLLSAIGVIAAGAGVLTAIGTTRERTTATAPASEAAAETIAPPTVTPAQQLLAADGDAQSCAISFLGDHITEGPELERAGDRFLHLPIPSHEGQVFAGWYDSAEAAAARTVAQRINGADLVACGDNRERSLHAAWMSPADLAADTARVPILMYHQFTDKPDGEEGWLKLNFYDIGAWREDLQYIRDGAFYLPTWDELDAFIDGALWLPQRSVIITDDDADPTWQSMAVPIVNEEQVLTTSFVITAHQPPATPSVWVQRRSHTNDMHRAGDNGQGLMVNLSAEEIAADLELSAADLGAKEVVAYPFGHYDDRSKEGVALAGFDLAVTIEHGYVTVGSDKLALPRIRMNWGMTVEDLAAAIG